MTPSTLVLLWLACAQGHAPNPAAASPAPVAAAAPDASDPFARDPFFLDTLLAWPGDRHGTFGPTGARLFTERLEPAPGLHGRFGYLHDAEGLEDLVRLRARLDGAPARVEDFAPIWHPSFTEATFALAVDRAPSGARDAPRLEVAERKWITDDDVAVVQWTISNPGVASVGLALAADSRAARDPWGRESTFVPLDLRSVANAHPWPAGRDAFTRRGPPDHVWVEGEACAEQHGSTGPDAKRRASGGRVLGSDFGGKAGDSARWDLATPALPRAVLTLRAARGWDGEAELRVELDGHDAGALAIPASGGWGDDDAHFRAVRIELPALDAGTHAVRLTSTRNGGNVNVDGFWIHAPSFAPPLALGATDRFASPALVEELRYAPGNVVVAGVPFELLDPAHNDGRGVIALRGGGDGDPARAFPKTVTIPIGMRVQRLHFLGIAAAGSGGASGDEVASFEVALDGGRWTGVGGTLRLDDVAARLESLPGAVHDAGALPRFTFPVYGEGEAVSITLTSAQGSRAPIVAAITAECAPEWSNQDALTSSFEFHGVPTTAVLGAHVSGPSDAEPFVVRSWGPSPSLESRLVVDPGASVTVVAACAFCADRDDARARLLRPDANDLDAHRSTYHAFFANQCPRFTCGDPLLEKLWWYRWFVVRHCMARPGVGNLQDAVFYEGMHGRWYPKVIGYSSPHIIAEVRWLKDPTYWKNQVRAHLRTADDDGLFRSVWVDHADAFYTEWIAMAAAETALLQGDRAFLAEILPALEKNVLGTFRRYDADDDGLVSPPGHFSTGMEFQPSFFAFNDYDDTLPEAALERPDFAAYHFGAARAVAAGWRELGDQDRAAAMESAAERIRAAALTKLWNDDAGYFDSIRASDDAPSHTPEIVAFYPWFTGLVPDDARYARSLRLLFDPAAFFTPFPFASCSRTVPVFTPHVQQWPGPGGLATACMWNGPTWPHADSIVLTALGDVLTRNREHGGVTKDDWRDALLRFARFHFEDGDVARPMLREYGDGETGVQWGCPDYFHSTWADLLFRFGDLADLHPERR